MITLKKDSVSITNALIISENGEPVIGIQNSKGLDYKLDISNNEIFSCENLNNVIELKNTRLLNRLMYVITGNSKYIGRKFRDYQLKV